MLRREDWRQIEARVARGVYRVGRQRAHGAARLGARRAPSGKRPGARRSKPDPYKVQVDHLLGVGV